MIHIRYRMRHSDYRAGEGTVRALVNGHSPYDFSFVEPHFCHMHLTWHNRHKRRHRFGTTKDQFAAIAGMEAADLEKIQSEASPSSQVGPGTNAANGTQPAITEEPRERAKRHRRRVFSCESCQRRKCKCLFDTALRSCRQCHSLRVVCSLRDSSHLISPTTDGDLDSSAQQQLRAMEDRLQRHEEAIAKLQEQLKHIPSGTTSASNSYRTPLPPRPRRSPLWSTPEHPNRSLQSNPEELLSAAADGAAGSAPVVVLREIDKHHTGRLRRKLGARSTDIVSRGIIDDRTSDSLIRLFHMRHGLSQFVQDVDQATTSQQLRVQYPFLHSTICLLGIMHHNELVGSQAHFGISEHVRQTLGEALLASPLTTDAIYAILLLSEEATDPSKDATDYIDSWLLTGYCVQQAMLCFNFSAILSRIQQETSTPADQSSVRLWAAICLGHLRWSVTTGRQPVVPSAYLNHCNMLVSFYDASSDDGMLLAEVMLFWALWQMPVDASERSDILVDWKNKWDHLLKQPSATKLWLSYHTASLISAIRVLESLGENLLSETFLTETKQEASEDLDTEGSRGPGATAIKAGLRQEAYQEAVTIIQQFLQSETLFKSSIRLSEWLCLAYSALIVGHYGERELNPRDFHRHLRDRNHDIHSCLESMVRLNDMCRVPVGSMRVLPHAVQIALGKLQAVATAAARKNSSGDYIYQPNAVTGQSVHVSATIPNQNFGEAQSQSRNEIQFFGVDDNMDALSNMNSFFSGGFLDFSYRDYMGQPMQ